MDSNRHAGLSALLIPENSVLLLIDHQAFQVANLHSHEPTLIINNVAGRAKSAKVFGVPTILTTVLEQTGGLLIPEIQSVFPDRKPINRTWINAWEDSQVVGESKKTGRRKIVMAGLWTEQVDLVIGGYGNNSLTPAMPLIIERKRYFVGLMGLGVNARFDYPGYFVMIPTGPEPNTALTEGFYALAARQKPRPQTVAIVAADADFSRNPILGARANADKHGLRIISETRYPLATKDFAPLLREAGATNPDILFLCSYLPDSIGLVRAINEVGFEPKMVGGAMIGPQSSSVQTALGPLLNGLVNYEYWLPVPKLMSPGVGELIERYQARAAMVGADASGYYVAPLAYAQMQVVEQAVSATQTLEDAALVAYTRNASFASSIGDVKFANGGEWSAARVLQVQFRNIRTNDVAEFKDARTRVVVSPDAFASSELIYPYADAKRARWIVGVSVPVLTANIESAIARYEALLREKVKARFVMPERGLTLALFGNVTLIGGAERDLARLKDLRAMFTVDSLAEFEAHLRASGAMILQPPARTPAGRNMVVRDVEGMVFELVEPRSPD